jgi:phage-related protein
MEPGRRLEVVFYREAFGSEPVREWLRGLDRTSKKIIGEDIKTVQFGWPLGMPLVRGLGGGLWEVRCNLANTTARILFVVAQGRMILLHGFIKKTRATPPAELALARKRATKVLR